MAPKTVISLILGCALLGGYASMFTAYRYGYFDALRTCVSSLSNEECVLDMSDTLLKSMTSVNAIDDLINILLEFFSQGLRTNPNIKGIDLEALLAFVYLAAQFGGAWYIVALEGLRQGNRGTILSWTGAFGAIFQAVTVTIVAPIYLTIQLLWSSSNVRPEALLVDPWDLTLLPISAILAYIVPTIGLCLPLLQLISGEAKLFAVALWQPFPLYHTIIRGFSRILHRRQHIDDSELYTASLKHRRQALRRSNRFIVSLAVTVHIAVMGTIFVSTTTELIARVSVQHTLAVTSLRSPPMQAMLKAPVSLIESREIVVAFLRWDVYCTCFAMLIWATYQRRMIQDSPGILPIATKALIYVMVGGPILPALMFIWERDEIALDMVASVRKNRLSAEVLEFRRGEVVNGNIRKRKMAMN